MWKCLCQVEAANLAIIFLCASGVGSDSLGTPRKGGQNLARSVAAFNGLQLGDCLTQKFWCVWWCWNLDVSIESFFEHLLLCFFQVPRRPFQKYGWGVCGGWSLEHRLYHRHLLKKFGGQVDSKSNSVIQGVHVPQSLGLDPLQHRLPNYKDNPKSYAYVYCNLMSFPIYCRL